MLFLLILIPLVSAFVIAIAPREHARTVAMIGSVVALCATLAAAMPGNFDWAAPGSIQMTGGLDLVPELGISLTVGVDSIALLLILLTALLGPLCVLGSFTSVTERERSYYAWLLVLQAAMVGVFSARDLIFFYVCFEFTLLPMYVLISVYGSSNRKKAATKFFLYTFTGSIVALAGLVYTAWWNTTLDPSMFAGAGGWTFDIAALTLAAREMSLPQQSWVLLAMLLGFAVKVPLFPVHTWLPLAHTEAPTAGSVILAGVLLKLGTYAIYRFVLGFVPEAVVEFAPVIATLSIIGIVYAGLICWVQRDVKRLVAYSSVSHLGFCVLGLVALNEVGLTGSVLYMINHGLSTGALFFLIGMMYERYHTRSMNELGGLARKMPVWAFFMGFFAMASVGLPGLNGFVSEFMCLMGAFQSGAEGVGGTLGPLGPWYAAAAGTGMIIAAIYLLFMVGKIVFGPLVEPEGHHDHDVLPRDLSPREIAVLSPLAIGCVVLGIYPTPVIETITPANEVVLAAYEPILATPAGAPRAGAEQAMTGPRPVVAIPVGEVAR